MDSFCSVGIVSLNMSKAKAASEDVEMEDIDIQDIEDNVSDDAPLKEPEQKEDGPIQQSQQPPSSQHMSSYKGAPKRQPQ